MKKEKQEEKREAKAIIEIGVETGKIRITNEGGKMTESKLPVDMIKGVVEVPTFAILRSKSSPG